MITDEQVRNLHRELAGSDCTCEDITKCDSALVIRAALEAAAGRDGWRPIEVRPAKSMQVELFFGRLVYTDEKGRPCLEVMSPQRDERRQLGFWDGETFREMGTGHCCFETWRTDDQLPTHWRPLPAPPVTENGESSI